MRRRLDKKAWLSSDPLYFRLVVRRVSENEFLPFLNIININKLLINRREE